MIKVLLDSAVLAVPNFGLSDEAANDIIDRAFQFSRAVSSHLHLDIMISEFAEDALWECGCGPDYATIDDFLEMMDLKQVFSTNDVLVAYHTLMSHAVRAFDEERLEVRTFTNFETQPSLPAALGPLALQYESKRVLTTSALAKQLGGSGFHIPGWSGDPCDVAQVTASVEVADVGTAWPDLELPAAVLAEVQLLSSLEMLISPSTASEAWARAEDSLDLHFAIGIRALAILRDTDTVGTGNVARFAMGPRFLDSLRENQCAGTGRMASITLELCAQIVAGRCNRYIGPMGKPKQVERGFDHARGWRVHLTDAHEGLRLMYWEGPQGFEFANVGPKWELLIEHGAKGAASMTDLSSLLD